MTSADGFAAVVFRSGVLSVCAGWVRRHHIPTAKAIRLMKMSAIVICIAFMVA